MLLLFKFLKWCTGVLTISSVIVGHKWFQKKVSREESPQCSLYKLPSELLHNFLSNPLQNNHVVLAVKPPTSASAAQSNDNESNLQKV